MREGDSFCDIVGRSDVPKNATDDAFSLPFSDKFDEYGFMEAVVEYLWDAVEVGDDHTL